MPDPGQMPPVAARNDHGQSSEGPVAARNDHDQLPLMPPVVGPKHADQPAAADWSDDLIIFRTQLVGL